MSQRSAQDAVTRGQIANQHTGARCTLDSKPATISGRLNQFATVSILPDGPAVEFAWETVSRVMGLRGGEFKS